MNTIHKLTNIITELSFKIEHLQEENEELKEKNAILILANSGIEEKNEQLNERVKTFTKPKYYYKGLQKTEEEKDKYKQALEEIKNLAELEVMLDKNSKAFYPTNIQRILDVINEVLK